MKRSLLLIFFFPYFSFAQNDWAPVGAKWNYTLPSMEGPEVYNQTIESVSDTIIHGIDCRKLSGDFGGCSPMNNYTYVYSDSEKVFYYNPVLDTFFLLYDLGLNPNQSYTIFISDFNLDLDSIVATVNDTSHLEINGQLLKVQNVSQTGSMYFIGTQIIERVGDTYFLFPQWGACDPGISGLRCYQDTAIGLYETGIVPYCDYTNVGINENETSVLETFPNPAHDFLYLKTTGTTQKELSYQILDNTGRTLLSGRTEKEINVQALSPGYYRIVFENIENRAFIKF